jgi:RHS repeat-associated protein
MRNRLFRRSILVVSVLAGGLVFAGQSLRPAEAVTLTYQGEVLSDLPIGYWPLNDPSTSTTAADLASVPHAGTFSGTTAQADGPLGPTGGSRHFNNALCEGVTLPGAPFKLQTFSVEGWVRTKDAGLVWATGDGGRGTSEFIQVITRPPLVASSSVFFAANTPFIEAMNPPAPLVPDGRWHHLVSTFSPTAGLRLYIDAQLVGTQPFNQIPSVLNYAASSIATIGNTLPGCNIPGTGSFKGEIAQVAFYNTVLPQARIASHYTKASGRALFSEPVSAYGGDAKLIEHIADPVNSATGDFTNAESDLVSPAGTRGLSYDRWYNSSDNRFSLHGIGWVGPFNETLTASAGKLEFAEPSGRVSTFVSNGAGGWLHPVGVEAQVLTRADFSLALSYADGTVIEFDTAGRFESRTSWDGQTITIARNPNGTLASVSSSTGQSLTYAYVVVAGKTRIGSVTGSWGQAVTFTYDPVTAALASVTRPGAVTTTYAYDPSDRLTKIIDATGVVIVENTYSTFGQVVSQKAANGAVTTFAYDPATLSTTVHDPVTNTDVVYRHDTKARVIAITDSYGKGVTRDYDAQNNVTSGLDRLGAQIVQTFDANSNLLTSNDPATGTTVYTYDTSNRVLTITDPWGVLTTYGYTGTDRIPSTVKDGLNFTTNATIVNGLVTSTTDADGITMSYAFGANRRLLSTTDGFGKITLFEYDAVGRRTKVTSPTSRIASTVYDAAGRVQTTTAPDLGVTSYTYDSAGRTLTVTDPTLAVTTNTYDAAGRLATVTAPNGAITTYTYDGNDQLVSTIEPGGATTSSVYGPLGRVTSTKDQLNRITLYEYDPDGNPTKVTNPTGAASITTYDTVGRVASTTDPAGRLTTTAYDAHGRLASTTAPGGLTTLYTYDTLSRTKTVTDPNGGVTTTDYTPAGRTAKVTDAANLITTYGYDLAGRPKTSTAPGGRVTTTTYDDDGRALTSTSPGGLVTTTAYDPAGRVASIIDAAGVATTRTWSKRGELLTEKHGAEGTVTYTYNPVGTMKDVTDALGNKTLFGYDLRGNRTSRTNALAGVDSWAYNTADELTGFTDPLNRSTIVTYDAAGRPATILDPSGRTVTNGYNPDGTLATSTAAISGGASVTDAYAYDVAGRLKSVSNSINGTTNYAYAASGALAVVRDPAGRTVSYSNDVAGRRSSIRYPSGNTFNYTYDTAGRLAGITPAEIVADSFVGPNGSPPGPGLSVSSAAAGTSAAIQNNELALVASASGPSPTITSLAPASTDKDITLKYRFSATTNATKLVVQTRSSAAGHYGVELVANSTTGTLYKQVGTTRTSLGTFTVPVSASTQFIRIIVSGTSIKVRVWADGAVQPTTFVSSVTDTAVTAAGTTTTFTQFATAPTTVGLGYFRDMHPTTAPPAIASYAYNLDDQLTAETLNGGAGGTRTRTYTLGRVTAFGETVPGAALSTSRTYDTTGRIGTETTGTVTTTYGYDAASQLLSATPSVGLALTYTYDNLGRRATSRVGAAAAITYGYDTASQLTSVGGSTIIYDLAGRRTSDTVSATDKATYAYDPAGRLAAISRVNGTTTTTQNRTYTPTGLLAKVTNTTGATTTVTGIDWDTNQTIPQPVDLVATTPTDLVYGTGGWAATKTGATVASIGQDIYGSAIPSTGVTATRSATYDPYGVPAGTNTLEPRLGHRGELTFDNLVYLRARNYDPNRGQFTSRDVLEGVEGTPTIANPYHFVDNSPLRFADPTGMTKDAGLHNFTAQTPPTPSLPRCGTSANPEGHFLTQIDTFEYSVHLKGGIDSYMDYSVAGGSESGLNHGCVDVYNKGLGDVWEIKPMSPYGLYTGPKQVDRYVRALNADNQPAQAGQWFEPHYIESPKVGNWGYITFSGVGRWKGVRFYVGVANIANLSQQTQWLAKYGKATKPGDEKKMFKQATKVRDKNVKTNAKWEYDTGAAKVIVAGTGAALVVVAGCATIVGCAPAATAVGVAVLTNENFAVAA